MNRGHCELSQGMNSTRAIHGYYFTLMVEEFVGSVGQHNFVQLRPGDTQDTSYNRVSPGKLISIIHSSIVCIFDTQAPRLKGFSPKRD